jgi:uncharacterized membrane protein
LYTYSTYTSIGKVLNFMIEVVIVHTVKNIIIKYNAPYGVDCMFCFIRNLINYFLRKDIYIHGYMGYYLYNTDYYM